jgi:hypothetical protein
MGKVILSLIRVVFSSKKTFVLRRVDFNPPGGFDGACDDGQV